MLSQWANLIGNLDRTVLKLVVWLLIAMLTMIPLERLFQAGTRPVFRRGFGQDLLYYFCSGLVPAFVLVLVYWGVAGFFSAVLPAAWLEGVHALPIWASFAATVVIGDLGFYWAHRWAHEVPFLWRFHAIHHSPEGLDWLVATRTHPLEIAYLRGMSFVPLFALGLVDLGGSQSVILMLFVVFNTFWGFFIHANVRLKLKWLQPFLSTPVFHHWHHADAPARNKNFAAMFPFIDRVFGTYLEQDDFPRTYGSSTRIPDGFAGQLVFPFRPGSVEPEARAEGAASKFDSVLP